MPILTFKANTQFQPNNTKISKRYHQKGSNNELPVQVIQAYPKEEI